MEKKTNISLVAQTRGAASFSFSELDGLWNDHLEYNTVLPENYEGGVHALIVKLLSSIRLRCENEQSDNVLKALFEHGKIEVSVSEIANSFTLTGQHGQESFAINVQVNTVFNGGTVVFEPWRRTTGPRLQMIGETSGRQLLCNDQQPRPTESAGGATYGRNVSDEGSVAFLRNKSAPTDSLSMLNHYIKHGTSPLDTPRDTLSQCLTMPARDTSRAELFKAYGTANPGVITKLTGLLEHILNVVRVVKTGNNDLIDEKAYMVPFHDLLRIVGAGGGAVFAPDKAFTLAVIDAIRRLEIDTRSGTEKTEKDFREEAELALFRTIFSVGLYGQPMVDYDLREVWDSAVNGFPALTAYGRRISPLLAQQEEESEVYDDADGEVLASVLEYHHSTPAAAAVALYVLENSEGVSTPNLLEVLPVTFVRDYSDYCTALGGAGPFGRKQLNAVKDALVKRWFISYDSALAVLNKNLGELDFNNNDPHIAGRLETAVAELMHDKTLLYIVAPE